MLLKSIEIKNFRLLREVLLGLEKGPTVIVGRNNSGKTSLAEVLKRLLTDKSPSFRLEDFSFCAHEAFWKAYQAHKHGDGDERVRAALPFIEVRLIFSYEKGEPLGLVSDLIVDLNEDCTEALVVASYALRDGEIAELFGGLTDTEASAKPALFKVLRERIPSLFTTTLHAVDPNDPTNVKRIDLKQLQLLCTCGFISAQRGLDDMSQKERVVIGKVLENLFATAKANARDMKDHATATALETAVQSIQDKIGTDFNAKLDALLPALKIFGYPGLTDPKLMTETTLNVDKLLSNHTRVLYSGVNGVHLPEAYNGLGARNIILILLQLRGFFKEYAAGTPQPTIQLVFIEEPEVHLHPQMQEVFIRKLNEIAAAFSKELGVNWPVQFIVTTHSSHVANEAHFEAIRYFLCGTDADTGALKSIVKDLRKGLADKSPDDRKFLHQYLTLTRCDLFFADKAILIEGTVERLLLPRMISMLDEKLPEGQKLASQYLSVIEVGGAYAHRFFDLLDFLEVPTLIITDIDTAKQNDQGRYESCTVSQGTTTSNACIKAWLGDANLPGKALVTIAQSSKISGKRRIAYQVPEKAGGPCGRSFEDALILANPTLFKLTASKPPEAEKEAMDLAGQRKKTEFALHYAITEAEWCIPRYISEGLAWLAAPELPPAPPTKKSGAKK